MARKSYKFTDKKHTRQGLLSMAFSGAALILTIAALILAYRTGGGAGSVAGLLGLLAMAGSAAGFVLALQGFREEDVYYLSARIGVSVSGVLFILWALVCVIGM